MNQEFAENRLDSLDRTLTTYFRSALPNPWPAAPHVTEQAGAEQAPFARPSFWRKTRSWAIAASVLFLVFGYLSLARFFPQDESNALSVDPTHRTIGSLPGLKKSTSPKIDHLLPMPKLPPMR